MFGKKAIEVSPIRTTAALCYKIEYLYKINKMRDVYLMIEISNKWEIDEDSKFNIFLAAENTWQGFINQNWPYSKIPPKFEISIPTKPGVWWTYIVRIEENVWKHRDGMHDFSTCFNQFDNSKSICNCTCTSMFNPYSYRYNDR